MIKDELPWREDDTAQEMSRESAMEHAGTSDAQPGPETVDVEPAKPIKLPAKLRRLMPLEPLDPAMFPDPAKGNGGVPGTMENLIYVFHHYGIVIRFNVIKKRPEIHFPGLEVSPHNRDIVTENALVNIAVKHGLPSSCVSQYLLSIADSYPYNPVVDWIGSRDWDREDRLPDFYATVETEAEYPVHMKRVLLRKFLLSVVAAATMPTGFRSRGVLTLQGAQGVGKTSFVRRLIPGPLGESVVRLGHSWDGGSKDARLSALSHLIVELGELEGSLRREMPHLKAFITEGFDKIRPPYARRDAEYPRQTVFCASVNEPEFLIDATGNSRFWTLPVIKLRYDHDVDMQQLFAQLKIDLDAGAQWWLTQEEDEQLAFLNQNHRAMGMIGEKIRAAIDLTRKDETDVPRLSATQMLATIGIDKPTNLQSKECNAALREVLGLPKRVNGIYRWYVPLKVTGEASKLYDPDSEIY